MDALIDLALNHGVVGGLVAIIAIGIILAGRIAYRHWRDLIAERDFYRDALIKALQAGEVLAGRDSGGEGGNG